MPEPSNVFISWSGSRSKTAAEAVRDWLPLILPAAKPWLSAKDIDKGTRWRGEIDAALASAKAGIICLTSDNLDSSWLLFEAGALSKTLDPKSRVWTYILDNDLKPPLKDPLGMFQATMAADREDTRTLIHSINRHLEPSSRPDNDVNFVFDKLWSTLDEKLRALPPQTQPSPPGPDPKELAEMSYGLLQAIAEPIQQIADEIAHIREKRISDERISEFLAQHPGGIVFNSAGTVVAGSTPTVWKPQGRPIGNYIVTADTLVGPTPSTPPAREPETPLLPSSPRRKKPKTDKR